jgi:hypothetical protein
MHGCWIGFLSIFEAFDDLFGLENLAQREGKAPKDSKKNNFPRLIYLRPEGR